MLLFLQSLASTTPITTGSAVIPPFLPALATNSLAPPSPINARSPSPGSRAYTPLPPSAGPPLTSHPSSAIPPASAHKLSGKTKATLLAEWRVEQRKAPSINYLVVLVLTPSIHCRQASSTGASSSSRYAISPSRDIRKICPIRSNRWCYQLHRIRRRSCE